MQCTPASMKLIEPLPTHAIAHLTSEIAIQFLVAALTTLTLFQVNCDPDLQDDVAESLFTSNPFHPNVEDISRTEMASYIKTDCPLFQKEKCTRLIRETADTASLMGEYMALKFSVHAKHS